MEDIIKDIFSDEKRYVISYDDFSNFPPVGTGDTIYFDSTTNALYIWNGSSYVALNIQTIWGYQDFAPGVINSTSATLTANENGTNAEFTPANFYNYAAIYNSDNTEYVYTSGFFGMFAGLVDVTIQSGVSITLNKIPNPATNCRIWYMFKGVVPTSGYTIPPENILDSAAAVKLDSFFLTPEDLSATAPIVYDSGTGIISLDHNTTNLQITADQLNTIQDINIAATPEFRAIQYTVDLPPPTYSEGVMFYDGDKKIPGYMTNVNGVNFHMDELPLRGTNKTGVTLTKGQVVYVNGAQGKRPTFALADASAEFTSDRTIGLVKADIANNGTGFVVQVGTLEDVNTLGLGEGSPLYLSTTAGAYTTTPPSSPDHLIRLGYVIEDSATTGQILISIIIGDEVEDLHDVAYPTALQDFDYLRYNLANLLWENTRGQDISTGASPTFVTNTLSGLTASRLMATDGSKTASSVSDLTTWLDATAPAAITDDGDGTATISINPDLANLRRFFYGTFAESFDAIATSDGATVTMSLEQTGGGDLTMQFSSGNAIFDTTPAATIALTAGSNASPTDNYVYILESTLALTLSTSDWPSTEHIKVGYFYVPSAAFVQASGTYINQNWNDHLDGMDSMGHMPHLAQHARLQGARYTSGIVGIGTDGYLTPTASNVELSYSSGVVYQLHKHIVPLFDTAVGDKALVKNWSGDAWHAITNLFDITADSTGTTIGNNKYFNLVIWGVANKTGEFTPTSINLPAGSYNTRSGAEADSSGFDDFSIPAAFSTDSSTGFLIARITIKMGTTWIVASTVDLRTSGVLAATGGSTTPQVEFPDNQFKLFDESDVTKIAEFQLSGITTATTRTLTIQDSDGTLAYLSDIGSGDVIGPASATDNAIARYDGITGKLIQNSSATIDDSGNIAATSFEGAVATPAQPAITSLGTLTNLQVDDININNSNISSTGGANLFLTPDTGKVLILDNQIRIDGGVVTDVTNLQVGTINITNNEISSTAGTHLQLTPFTGETIILDGTIVIDGGVVTGITSITANSITSLGDVDITGELSVSSGRILARGNASPTSGTQVEIGHNGTNGIIISFDRDLTVYKNMRYSALSHEFEIEGVDKLVLDNSGNLVASGTFKTTDTTDSTSKTTGALVSSGGLGVAKTIHCLDLQVGDGGGTHLADFLGDASGTTNYVVVGVGSTSASDPLFYLQAGNQKATVNSRRNHPLGFSVNNIERMNISTSGEITSDYQPKFHAYVNANVNNVTGDGTLYTIIGNTEKFDIGSNYSTSTGIFTAPVDGQYQFNGTVTLNGILSTHTTVGLYLVTTGATYILNSQDPSNSAASGVLTISGGALVELDAAQTAYLRVVVFGTGGKVVDILGSSGSQINSRFSGTLII